MLKISRPIAYVILGVAIAIEVLGDAMLTASNGYEHVALGVIAILIILFSFYMLSKVLHIINIAVAYATWGVTGALASTFIGLFAFDQHISVIGWISIVFLAGGTFVLNMWGTPSEKDEGEEESKC